jgi:hypothetical protein
MTRIPNSTKMGFSAIRLRMRAAAPALAPLEIPLGVDAVGRLMKTSLGIK